MPRSMKERWARLQRRSQVAFTQTKPRPITENTRVLIAPGSSWPDGFGQALPAPNKNTDGAPYGC